ncbi:Carbohydrate-binding WSC, subgroup [Penicillium griseofulvum]|uniref:Carbohydrate-binding WSC, subgroup n=1 Tax=Penicillium patulum TaxID=5078 RepID=A0A135LB09_PENPA|nr:Carbohydrate-binding WSC, subgroup [Penicillium griseofulvum]KXG46129.1 Carbohydrate-binding WSC, subgroup [Penicillium griseofulvum]
MRTNYIFSALALALPVFSASSTSKGCYSEVESFKSQGPYTFQSPGYCQSECARKEFKIAALSRGNVCYCGDKVPSDSAKVADDKCDMTCPGWPDETCGGKETYNVFEANEDLKSSGNATSSARIPATAAGGIVVAPSATATSTGIMTANASKSAASGSGASSTASPTPTNNAAGTVRAGSSLLGAAIAGMGLLL